MARSGGSAALHHRLPPAVPPGRSAPVGLGKLGVSSWSDSASKLLVWEWSAEGAAERSAVGEWAAKDVWCPPFRVQGEAGCPPARIPPGSAPWHLNGWTSNGGASSPPSSTTRRRRALGVATCCRHLKAIAQHIMEWAAARFLNVGSMPPLPVRRCAGGRIISPA